MFCDLVGSTALATRLDPEDLRDVIAAYHACVADVVRQHEGFYASTGCRAGTECASLGTARRHQPRAALA
jgi:class 3 adenylate cyclase